jgi:hypothetical protein
VIDTSGAVEGQGTVTVSLGHVSALFPFYKDFFYCWERYHTASGIAPLFSETEYGLYATYFQKAV